MKNYPLVSIIMSTYNETIDELSKSINSVLQQTYRNFEFIIVCDNPNNKGIVHYLENINDNRVHITINDKNRGLVWSLNHALKYANGDYIARMDADDICCNTRLIDQFQYLVEHKCDLIGSFIRFIDENGKTIQEVVMVPVNDADIRRQMKWGSVLTHPTWFGKRKVFEKLNGYRDIPYCEDYDFLIRAINDGFVLGNVNKVELSYRIRSSGISKSNENSQFVIHDFLAKKYKLGKQLSEDEVKHYISSKKYCDDIKKRERYNEIKKRIETGSLFEKAFSFIRIISYKYFWHTIYLKIVVK